MDPGFFNKNWPFFAKMFLSRITFFSRRDTKNLKTPLHFSRQDTSKHVSGDLKKSILKLDPRSGLLTLTHYVRSLQPYRKYFEAKFKNCFSTYWGIWSKNPAGTPCKSKKVFLAPPPTVYNLLKKRVGWVKILKNAFCQIFLVLRYQHCQRICIW